MALSDNKANGETLVLVKPVAESSLAKAMRIDAKVAGVFTTLKGSGGLCTTVARPPTAFAWITALPVLTPVTKPLAEIVTAGLEELHVIKGLFVIMSFIVVMSCVLPSLNVPTACSCWLLPAPMMLLETSTVVILIDCNTAGVIVTTAGDWSPTPADT